MCIANWAGQQDQQFGEGKAGMLGLRLTEVTAPDAKLLGQIGKLRVRAWATLTPEAAAMNTWLDKFEAVGRHWVVFRDTEPVAAARLSIHSSIDEVPDAECFEGVFQESPAPPIASFNRLVVDPSARGLGLSRRLDEARLAAAEAAGCRSAIGSTMAGERRLRQVVTLGFVVVGLGNPDLHPPCCYAPRPMVYLCRLPRTSGPESTIQRGCKPTE